MRLLTLIAIALGTFVAMEVVSYATHRWVMHGFGMRWHRSHHLPAQSRFEANDVFPVAFSFIGFGLFLAAALAGSAVLFFGAAGVTAYGITYLFVHDMYIHRRVAVQIEDRRYLRWVRDSHSIHHIVGGEPYGMLLPVVSGRLRAEAARRDERRASNRETRSRL